MIKRKNEDLLSLERHKLRQQIQQDIRHDRNIVAAFYGGSIGEKNEDVFSDIDLRIVVHDRAFDQYRKQKRNRAMQWGNILFFEDPISSAYTVAHYDSFIKVDTFYYREKDISPSLWLKDIHIFHDPKSLMKNVQSASQPFSYNVSKDQVEYWASKFLAHFHEKYRRLMRGELYYALNSLDSMRFLIASGWCMQKGIHPYNYKDWAKIEGSRSQLSAKQLVLLQSWDCDRSQDKIMKVAKSMLPQFLSIYEELCFQTGLEYDEKHILSIINLVYK